MSVETFATLRRTRGLNRTRSNEDLLVARAARAELEEG